MRFFIILVFLGLLASSCTSSGGRRTSRDAGSPPDTGAGAVDSGGGGAHCGNGLRDGDETHLDCGGSCDPCADGAGCARPTDCLSGVCVGGFCLMASCMDGILNQDETDVDCGGALCGGCDPGGLCTLDSDCASGLCDTGAGTCASTSCMDGVQNSDETDIDCGGSCPGCPGDGVCNLDADCASLICVDRRCTTATCDDRVQNGDETDEDCGGSCPGCRDASMCLVDADCESMQCQASSCISCVDGRQNGLETDVDCGGGSCDPCADTFGCAVATDCASGVCTAGACAVPACDDTVQNGDETDVDCGGTCGATCPVGDMCTAAADCASGICTAGTCAAPSCTDSITNGGETDVDCGGPTACPRCADRRRCMAASDCATGTCTSPPGRCGVFAGCYWGLISQETQFTNTNIQRLFDDNGHTYDVLSNNGMTGVHSANATTLSGYTHIILHEHDRVLSAAESTALTAWVNGGGRLIVTGYDSLGSPTDSVLAGLVRCSAPGDGPFSGSLTVVDASHQIAMGPAQTFTMGQTLTAASTDHDQCTPTGGAVRLVSVSTSSKLQIAEGIGAGGGMVVYWNGNGTTSSDLRDWDGTMGGTQPALQNLFVNTIEYLCSAP